MQGSGAASPDRGSGGGAGGGSGVTSGNDSGGSSGSGGDGSGGFATNADYLKALRAWGESWAFYFKSLAEDDENIQIRLTKILASCSKRDDGKGCVAAAIKEAEQDKQAVEKKRQEGIARMAKEKAAIDAMKPSNSNSSVPMPDGVNGVGGGNGNNTTNNNITNNITNNDTTINNNTNITHNGGSSGGGKSGGNGNGGSGQTGNNMGNDRAMRMARVRVMGFRNIARKIPMRWRVKRWARCRM